MKRVRIIISGQVQGVFFRQHTKDIARKLGLKGYVKNLADGGVEVVAEGQEEKLRELVGFCKRGPNAAKVEGIKVSYENAKNEFRGFEIRY